MLENVASMFDDMEIMLKKLKKKTYESRMKEFRTQYNHYVEEMTQYVESADQKEAAAEEVADSFIHQVKSCFEVKGKIKPRTQADMNFMMIYYVFPAILLTEHEDAKLIADTICSAWGQSFKDSKIGYTTYEHLYESFREKIFGIF